MTDRSHSTDANLCTCGENPGSVPVLSVPQARRVLDAIPPERRAAVVFLSFEWLTERHPHVLLYEGIRGRNYTDEEKDTIALDIPHVAATPCPFRVEGECVLGGLGPEYTLLDNGQEYCWLPTAVARLWEREQFNGLIDRGQIADGKIAKLTRKHFFDTVRYTGDRLLGSPGTWGHTKGKLIG